MNQPDPPASVPEQAPPELQPSAAQVEESIATCRFAQRVAMISNRIAVNEEARALRCSFSVMPMNCSHAGWLLCTRMTG
jgi:hypothetical protein